MKIRLKAAGPLRSYLGGAEESIIPLKDGDTILRVLEYLKIPSEMVMAAAVNGDRVNKDHLLADSDELLLIPLMGGG